MKRMPTVIGFAVFLSQAPASAQKIPPYADFRATPPEPKLLAGDVDSGCRKRRDRFPIEIDRRRGAELRSLTDHNNVIAKLKPAECTLLLTYNVKIEDLTKEAISWWAKF